MSAAMRRLAMDGLLLAVAALGTPGGQLLMRHSVYDGRTLVRPVEDLLALPNLTLGFCGFLIYLAGVLAGLALVWRRPVSLAYPVMVGAMILSSALLTVALTGDTLGLADLAGALLVVCGVALLAPRLSRG